MIEKINFQEKSYPMLLSTRHEEEEEEEGEGENDETKNEQQTTNMEENNEVIMESTYEEFEVVISRINNGKASGYDKIHA